MSVADLSCPSCGAELTIEQLFGHAQDQRAFAHLATISLPLGARVLQYVALFAPAKNRMTLARKTRLIEQLLPDLQRQAINHNGRDWEAPLSAWATAIDGMLQQRDQGKLRLPLTGNGYLYAVLAGLADKVERNEEIEREQSRRHPQAQSTTTTTNAGGGERVFTSAADVLAANPHLRRGAPQ